MLFVNASGQWPIIYTIIIPNYFFLITNNILVYFVVSDNIIGYRRQSVLKNNIGELTPLYSVLVKRVPRH